MSSFILKIIAVISMLFDHIGDAIVGHFSNFNLIGRIAFPIFAYQSVQGYLHTKNFKKHLFKLLVFAFISQAPFMLFLSTFTNVFSLNVLFTFFIGLFSLFVYDKCKNKVLGILFVIFSSLIAELIRVDYGAFGILLIFSFYFFENEVQDKKVILFRKNLSYNKILMTISTIILCFTKYSINTFKSPNHINTYLACALFTSLSIIFILFYNKKEGPKTKYFFYVFYPLHLLILYFIHMWL